MKKRTIVLLLILLALGCSSKNVIKSSPKEELNTLKISIDNKEYQVNLEKNETVKALLEILPLNLTMQELNGNEKYTYLENSLPSSPKNPGRINEGDVMLYGSDCLVIFYKSFDTSYSYTKIGHINNLEDLDNNDVIVKITE